jgi:TonB-dependent receptor
MNFSSHFFVKRTILFVMTSTLLFSQNIYSQNYIKLKDKITISKKINNSAALVKLLQQQTSYTYIFNEKALEKQSINYAGPGENTLGNVLQFLHTKTGLDIQFNGNVISFLVKEVSRLTGIISGKVMDEENGDALPNVTLILDKTTLTTDMEGKFSLQLPSGLYAVELSRVGYLSKKITEVKIRDEQTTFLDIVLKRGQQVLSGVVVTSTMRREGVSALYARQKNNAAITDGISSEQIVRTPDNNAAQILKRVNGVTVQDDKFVTIRGLSERYNNVILNGATLPSTEPNRRNFSFDIIPSGLIDNIVVNKTATPDMPSEFVGGLVQVNTRSIPERNFLSLTIGSGINTNSAGKDMLSTKRGKNDYLGFDDGTKRWWNRDWNVDEYRQVVAGGNKEKRSQIERRIPNNWGLRTYAYSPVQDYQASLGRKLVFKDNLSSLGMTLAATYRHEEVKTDEYYYYPNYFRFDNPSATYNFNTSIGAVANIGFQTKGHTLAFKNLYNHRFNNETTAYYGADWSSYRSPMLRYINIALINTLWQNRLEGEHLLGKKLKFDWGADHIELKRDQPDTRSSEGRSSFSDFDKNTNVPGQYRFYVLNDQLGFLTQGINIYNATFAEQRKNLNANLTLPFQVAGFTQSLKAGYAGIFRNADYRSQALRTLYTPTTNAGRLDSLVFGKTDYELHQPELFQPGLLQYLETSSGGQGGFRGDDYTGRQQIHAGYLMTDLKFLSNFRLIGGVRLEKSNMTVTGTGYRYQTGQSVDTTTNYKKTDWLPSANMVYSLTKKMNVRVAYSKTLARAEFRERAPFVYYDFREGVDFTGARGLKDAVVDNFDLRYEYYPGPGEILSISLFHKKFKNPVEVVAHYSQSTTPNFFYYNLTSSTNTGVELDIRKSLQFINPASRWLRHIIVNANASWMKANVKYNTESLTAALYGIEVDSTMLTDSRERPLQGLSPYIINAGIGYFGDKIGININYNRYGERIVFGGFYPQYDMYEKPRDVLDIQLSTTLLKKRLLVRLNISDLLQQDKIIYTNWGIKALPLTDFGSKDNYESRPLAETLASRKYDDGDYIRRRSFSGRNLSVNVTYTF